MDYTAKLLVGAMIGSLMVLGAIGYMVHLDAEARDARVLICYKEMEAQHYPASDLAKLCGRDT